LSKFSSGLDLSKIGISLVKNSVKFNKNLNYTPYALLEYVAAKNR